MVVKVHGSAMAACPQRVMVCLIELGVDFELIHVDLDSLEQKKPEFLLLQVLKSPVVISDKWKKSLINTILEGKSI